MRHWIASAGSTAPCWNCWTNARERPRAFFSNTILNSIDAKPFPSVDTNFSREVVSAHIQTLVGYLLAMPYALVQTIGVDESFTLLKHKY